jgi:Flp pilus assembly pilin Flp
MNNEYPLLSKRIPLNRNCSPSCFGLILTDDLLCKTRWVVSLKTRPTRASIPKLNKTAHLLTFAKSCVSGVSQASVRLRRPRIATPSLNERMLLARPVPTRRSVSNNSESGWMISSETGFSRNGASGSLPGAAEEAVSHSVPARFLQEVQMNKSLHTLWSDQQGQDIAEYAVMLAVILVLVVGTIRLIGSNSNNVFSSVASSVH